MEEQALKRANDWAKNPAIDEQDRKEIIDLIDGGFKEELVERFYRDLEFGTGGMRAKLGQGTYRMNKYNIRKASQAVASTVLKEDPIDGGNHGIAISYDSRRFSEEFAKEAACVFAANGITAYLFKRMNPVALVSFSTRHNKCNAGVMVTASHNPPEYNGYKVFWGDGAQVTPPNDKNVIDQFNSITDYASVKLVDFDSALKENKIVMVGEEVEDLYYDAILGKAINPELCKNNGEQLKIIYTALHGTGHIPCNRALNDLGFTNILNVPEQQEPNGDFPTVSSPNPENAEALDLGVKLMKKEGGDMVMGTDPDTDRVGIALEKNGKIIYLNGNQIGILMLHYICSNLQEQGRMPKDPYYVRTIVTTPLQDKIAEKYGVEKEVTLTGFKWICGRVNEIEKEEPNRNFVFGTEESFGYLNHDYVRDKDGVSSIALLSEIALYYKLKGKDLVDALDDIYSEFGFSHETLLCLVYEGKAGAEKIDRIMEHFRNLPDPMFANEAVHTLKDYKSGEANSYFDNSVEKLNLPPTNALGFFLKSGDTVFLRPSGTEPKIKFYIMLQVTEGSLEEKKKKAEDKTETILSYIKEVAERT
ncbi:MAG: hypothetical protein CME70_03820 [Halobacteriovorax sp.]|nr:hypothetical protein [Halobacteriovorax sp.]|tara:strand:- start:154219 stop:155985 length:1767 start_codon:yes stop_codon:yes gene_type:complete